MSLKISAKWVQTILNENHKTVKGEIFQAFNLLCNKGRLIFIHILMYDELWKHYTSETKRLNMK